jgi:hypothetical protein
VFPTIRPGAWLPYRLRDRVRSTLRQPPAVPSRTNRFKTLTDSKHIPPTAHRPQRPSPRTPSAGLDARQPRHNNLPVDRMCMDPLACTRFQRQKRSGEGRCLVFVRRHSLTADFLPRDCSKGSRDQGAWTPLVLPHALWPLLMSSQGQLCTRGWSGVAEHMIPN